VMLIILWLVCDINDIAYYTVMRYVIVNKEN